MNSNDVDRPKTLGDPDVLNQRLQQIWLPHVAPLTEFVLDLRKKIGNEAAIPYFDPLDAGINAEVLFLLEAPGPKAVNSGFVSINNPDETAKNMFELTQEAGIPRDKSVIWNIVPWYIGSETRIRPAKSGDIEKGTDPLIYLLKLLQKLRAIILAGKKAQAAERKLKNLKPSIPMFSCPHPSPLFVNRRPENRRIILEKLMVVTEFLNN